jgi:hypothetical protein
MLALCQSCFNHMTPIQLTLNFVLFQLTHPQCAFTDSQTHRNTCQHVFHAASKPIQVLLHPYSHQSTCLTHAVLFPQFLHQCHRAHLSSTPTPPNHQLHALRALPAFLAFPVARTTRNTNFNPVSSCFGLCSHPTSPHAPLHSTI